MGKIITRKPWAFLDEFRGTYFTGEWPTLPEMLEITDIYKTSVCHLARQIRKILKEKKIRHLPVVYSKEVPCKIVGEDHVPGSVSFVPPVSGMMMAGYAVRKLLEGHMPKQG